jgi:hypothetical protein
MDNATMVKLIFGLQGTMTMALIAVYIWSFKLSQNTDAKIGKLYETINRHIQTTSIHQNDSSFVRTDLCNTINRQLSSDLTEIKSDVKELIKKAG